MTPERELQLARRGTLISILAYALVALSKLGAGHWLGSSALTADGFNNFADTINSILLFVGIHLAYRPADHNHHYGHRKMESITTLAVSFIILYIGIQVTIDAVKGFLAKDLIQPNPTTALIAGVAGFVMLGIYSYNSYIARTINSSGMKATAKDNLADALTSFVTAAAILTSQFSLYWVDGLMALIVGFIIIKTGLEIFKESAFELSDGFSPEGMDRYRECIYHVPGVRAIQSLRARTYGPHVYIDVTILVDPDITVRAGHDITEAVEAALFHTHAVDTVDVHVEPYE